MVPSTPKMHGLLDQRGGRMGMQQARDFNLVTSQIPAWSNDCSVCALPQG